MFKVVEGGLSEKASDSRKKFISAYVTNTRLMGVVGICMQWELIDNDINTRFYQFFYLDAEEYGFESYEEICGPDTQDTLDMAESVSSRMMGGLGGRRVAVTEREARALVQDYVYMNMKAGIEIPGEGELDFILKPAVTLDLKERLLLTQKQCEEILNEYQLINYFMMRCAGHDFEMAKYLSRGFVNLSEFRNDPPGTLIRNESELAGSDIRHDGSGSFSKSKLYLCQSLIEQRGSCDIVNSRIVTENLTVTGFEIISRESLSDSEVYMLNRRNEYVLLNDLLIDSSDFNLQSAGLSGNAQETAYESGRLFMIFYPDNKHVMDRVYRIFDDVLGTVYVSDFGQLLVSSFKRENIDVIEKGLRVRLGAEALFPAARYSFDSPVLYEFINSGFEDFEDFVDAISMEDPE